MSKHSLVTKLWRRRKGAESYPVTSNSSRGIFAGTETSNVLQKYQHSLVKPTEKRKAVPYPTSSIGREDPPRPFANSPQLWAGPQKLSFFPLRNPNVCTAIERTQKTWSHLQALHCGGNLAKIAVLDKNLQKTGRTCINVSPLLRKILPTDY